MNDGRTRVMLVDDHAVVRMGFRLLLEGSPEFSVVAEAESGEEAVRLLTDVPARTPRLLDLVRRAVSPP